MNLRLLSHDLRYKINQIDLPPNYDSGNSNSIYQLNKNNYKDFNLNLTELFLPDKKSKTDFINQVFCTNGLIISKRIANEMAKFKLPNHRAFKILVNHKNQKFQYYLLYLNFDILYYCDFSNSKFYSINGLNEREKIAFQNLKQYQELLEETRGVYSKENNFKDEFGMPKVGMNVEFLNFRKNTIYKIGYAKLILPNKILDKFDLIKDVSNFYVSERLEKKLKEMNASGIIFKEAKKAKLE